MRINHVIEDSPRDVGSVEAGGRGECGWVRQKIDAQGGEPHYRAPRERESKNSLGVVGYALREGIGRNEEETRDAVEEARGRELDEDSKAREELGAGVNKAAERSYGPPGDGAELGSADVRVEVAIMQVVDGAARAAHDEGASEEEQRRPYHLARGSHRKGHGSRHQGRKETWEVEVVCPGGLVETDEFGVGDPGLGEVREGTGRRRLVGFDGWLGLGVARRRINQGRSGLWHEGKLRRVEVGDGVAIDSAGAMGLDRE